MLRITPSVSANRTEIARMTPRQSAIRIEQVRGSNVILRRGVRVMDQSPEELKQKAARYRDWPGRSSTNKPPTVYLRWPGS